jgi:protein-S-isoprenylcysteine O-methyltransferase Ste14
MGKLQKEKPIMEQKTDHPKIVVNPFIIYIGLAVLAVLLHSVLPLFTLPELPAQVIGVVLILLNFFVGAPALRNMLKVKTSPNPHRPSTALLESGVYRFTRNPMYIGLTLAYAGLMFFFQISWGLVFIPLLIWLITKWVIIPEEEYLQIKFGDEYLQYQANVHRWL